MSKSYPNPGRRTWLTHYAPLIIWTFVILGLGSSMGSMNETSRFVRPLLEFLFPNAAPETLTLIHGYFRKLAHFVEYGVLGLMAFRAFRALLGSLPKAVISALLLAVAVASMDEIQQSFNPARTSSPVDVLIDLAGAAAAIAFFGFISQHDAKPDSAKTTEP